MREEIEKVIRENLPAQVSEELAEYLKDFNKNKQELEELKHKVKDLKAENNVLTQLSIDKESIASREKELAKDKTNFEVYKRDFKIEVLQEQYKDVRSLMHDVFRNQRLIYRTNTQGNVSTYNSSSCGYDTSDTTTTGEEERVEE